MIVDVGVPVVVVFLMCLVGLDLTKRDFARVAESPRVVLGATLGHIALVPLIVVGIILATDPDQVLRAGIILLAAAPAGALSNFYVYLAGANTALSVTLTALSVVAAFITMPLVSAAGVAFFWNEAVEIQIPVLGMMGQLLMLMVLPIGLGMWIRAAKPAFYTRHQRLLRIMGMTGVIVVLILLLVDHREAVWNEGARMAGTAALFTLCAMAAGLVVARVLRLSAADRITVIVEFAARNTAVVALTAVALLDSSAFALFAAVFTVAQIPLIGPVVLAYRRRTTATTAAVPPRRPPCPR
jgi:BASS family bile acid:Na+ symporter